jgi:hypothetical protein
MFSWAKLRAAASFCFFVCLAASCYGAAQQNAAVISIPLHVPAGTPLRVYLTKKVPYRTGALVEGKFAAPVWSFDRVVIPAGTLILGHVTRLRPVPRLVRVSALVSGNFTPLKQAEVSFDQLILPDGRKIDIHTDESIALPGLYRPPKPEKHPRKAQAGNAIVNKTGKLGQFAESQVSARLSGQTYGLLDFVRGQNRREWIEEFLLNKLPYRPQWYRSGSLFNATLTRELDFGTVRVSNQYLKSIGTQPAPDSVAQIRLVSAVSSAESRVGDPIEGVLATPVFSKDRRLVLPEGTKVRGKITVAQRARLLHRGGKLRFILEEVKPPEIAQAAVEEASVSDPSAQTPVRAQLIAAAEDPKKLKVDEEGTAKAAESKTRFLRPAIATLIAGKSVEDEPHFGSSSTAATGTSNTAGLALGGFSGFGIMGLGIAAPLPAPVGAAFGVYGLGWSVYSNLLSRGGEVRFDKNALVAVRFGSPPPQPAKTSSAKNRTPQMR